MAGIEESYDDCGGMLQSDDVRIGFVSGETFRNRVVQYSVVDGLAVFEGCIVLGRAYEMDEVARNVQSPKSGDDDGEIAHGVGITGNQYRWPGGLMPYEIDPALPNQGRVTDAISHWTQNTSMLFVARTAANAGSYCRQLSELCALPSGDRVLVPGRYSRRAAGYRSRQWMWHGLDHPCDRPCIRVVA